MLLLLVEPYAAHRCNRIGSARPTKLGSTLSLRIDPIKRLRLSPALQRQVRCVLPKVTRRRT
jgi:hypothetical protein